MIPRVGLKSQTEKGTVMDKLFQMRGEPLDILGEILGVIGWILTAIPFGIARIFGIQFFMGYTVDY